jgi:hypothetical protein
MCIQRAHNSSLFANYRSCADAVMELVDNAIDSRLKDSPRPGPVRQQSSCR